MDQAEYQRQYWEANKARLAAQAKARYQAHREERLAKQKAYYAAHREERIEYAKQYQQEHQEDHRHASERHRKKDPEATRVYNRAYYRRTVDHQRPLKAAEQRAAQRTKAPNRAKKVARDAVATALKNGTLVKPLTCLKCGLATTRRRLHAHHEDYSQPLAVTWLCSLCHGEVHQT